MKRAWLCALAVMGAEALAQPVEFKGVPMGASISDLRNGMGEWFSFSCSGDEEAEQSCRIDGFTYANEKVRRARATFDKGRLTSVWVEFDAQSFDAVAGALREKYGPPRSDIKFKGKNAYGAEFPQRSIAWTVKSGGAISAMLRPTKVDEAMVLLQSAEAVAAEGAAAARKPPPKKDI